MITLLLRKIDGWEVDVDNFENHISIKKYTKHFQTLFQKVFILNKYQTVS